MDTETDLTTKPTTEQAAEIVRLEPNVEELPLFPATKRSRRQEVVVRSWLGRDPATGKPINQGLVLRPAAGLGLPAERERDLYYLVISPSIEHQSLSEQGIVGPIRYADACRMLGWTRTGPNYRQVREAVKTLAALSIEVQNAVVEGKTRTLTGFVGHLFDAYYYEESEERRAVAEGKEYSLRRGEFYLVPARWFKENHLNNYLKPTDLRPYRLLQSAIAKALYGFLDKRAYNARLKQYRPEVRIPLTELRERFRLSVKRMKDLLREFRHAHDELAQTWPALKSARIEKLGPGRYEAVYEFSNQTELVLEEPPAVGERAPAAPIEPHEPPDPLAGALTRRGISARAARKLVQEHDAAYIRQHLDVHDQELATGAKLDNPAGKLRVRIEDNLPPFEGYAPPDQRAAEEERRRAYQERREQERAEQEALRAQRAAMTPEQRADEDLDLWLHRRLLMGGEPPTAEERQAHYEDRCQLR